MNYRLLFKAKYLKDKTLFDCVHRIEDSQVNPLINPWIPWCCDFRPTTKENIDSAKWSCFADLRLEDGGGWNRDLLMRICKPESVEAILRIEWPHMIHEDKLLWLGDSAEGFSVKSCYKEIIKHRIEEVAEPIWNDLWKSQLHERLKIHLWRMLAEVLPTWELLSRRLSHKDSLCSSCGVEAESGIHIFQRCQLSCLIAFGSKWGGHLDFWNWDNICQMMDFCLKSYASGGDRELQVFWATFFYMVWQVRCTLFFEGVLNIRDVIRRFNVAVEDFIVSRGSTKTKGPSASSSITDVRWSPPPTGWIKVNVDAAHTGLGAAAAMVVRNDHGKLLFLLCNVVADLAAKHTLSFGCSLFGDEFSIVNIPSCISDALLAEQAVAAFPGVEKRSPCDPLTTLFEQARNSEPVSVWFVLSFVLAENLNVSMAVSKLLILSILLALIFTHVRADAPVEQEDYSSVPVGGSDGSDSLALKIELDQLKSKIHTLESQVNEKTQELKRNDDIITQKEKIIRDKSDSISSLESEVVSLQKKGSLYAEEQVGKAHARAGELEKQVEKLKRDLEAQQKEKEALEARANEAEKKIKELGSTIEKLQKVSDEQKTKIRKTERALKVAEEEMMRAKFDATSKTKELTEVHGAWLPPWLAVHLFHCQSFIETEWNEHGKPALDLVTQKALEKKAQAEKWAEPHVETIKTKWIPSIKEQWLVVKTSAEPHLQMLTTKTIEVYESSKSALAPHVVKVQEVVDPYFQEAKKFSKPYIDQVATVTKPYVDRVHEVLKPYIKEAVHAYGKFLQHATAYHQQVQATVRETLKRHELTKPLATKEFEWFAASALLALPIIILFRIVSSIFCKNTRKPARNVNANHARRKHKRGHPDK
ncbi:hypothetical protein FNV43_RR11647 [Rhamnella rubrinervis]|uniref:Reverse transcriptase zinc-binding domain-containing protein n=1 Tax=Rhamnella rubrinervis TaxID=2594499 RepID=A0A8K0MI22_9ROSA|nr:hypothetical protein FNV43_RR11647 [Rhamnella rubrinervis]